MQYAETTANQTGYRRSGKPIVRGNEMDKIARLLEFQEKGNPKRIAEHDRLLAKYNCTRDTEVLWNFDIDFDVVPAP